MLGQLLDYVLEKRQEKVVIMGATSGDTGSAAIEGTKRCKNVDIFILHLTTASRMCSVVR